MPNFRYSQDEQHLYGLLTTSDPDLPLEALPDARAGLFLWAYVVSEAMAQALQQQIDTWKLFAERIENAKRYFPGDIDRLCEQGAAWKPLKVDLGDLGGTNAITLRAGSAAVQFWLTRRWEVLARGEGLLFSVPIPELRNPGEARSVAAGLVKRALAALAPLQGEVPPPFVR